MNKIIDETSISIEIKEEYQSGVDSKLTVNIGKFHKDEGVTGDYARMPYHDQEVDVFVWNVPLLHACVKFPNANQPIAETTYYSDGISQTLSYVDTETMGRNNASMFCSLDIYQKRKEKVLKKMERENLDALFITDLHDIVYLCGHHTEGGSFVALVITKESRPFLIGRYLELGDSRLLNGSNVFEKTYISEWWCIEDHADTIEGVRLALKTHGLEGKKIGFEYRGLSKGDEIDQYKRIKGIEDNQGRIVPATEKPLENFCFVDVPKFIEEFRLIKSDLQIENIRKAGAYAEIGIKAGIDAIKIGACDREIIAHIIFAMMMAGSKLPAYGPFVSIGPTSSRGHATGEGDHVKPGDLICIEVGGSYHRMHCASMQMCYMGKELPQWLVEAEMILTEIFHTVLPQMKPGVPACDIHEMVNKIYSKSRFWYRRYARSSYNIGGKAFPQDWSEGSFSCIKGNDEPLQAGLVQHFIPWASTPFGAYFKSVTVCITEQGATPLMNFSTKVNLIS